MAYIRAILLLLAGIALASAEFNARYVLEKRGVVTCESVLSPELCKKWKDIAVNLKLSASVIDDAVRETVKHGITSTKEVAEKVKEYVENLITNTKCEDLLAGKVCEKLRAIARSFKVKVDLVDKAVKDAFLAGKQKAEDIFDYCKEMLQTYIRCELWLGDKTCTTIKNIANRVGVAANEVDQKLREIIASGKTLATDIYNEILQFIKDKFSG